MSLPALLRLAASAARVERDDGRTFVVGALAVRRDGCIVQGRNGCQALPSPSAHAEARVLRKSGDGATFYVARVRKGDRALALARPCDRCFAALVSRRAPRVYYTISDCEYGVIDLS